MTTRNDAREGEGRQGMSVLRSAVIAVCVIWASVLVYGTVQSVLRADYLTAMFAGFVAVLLLREANAWRTFRRES